MKTVPRGIHSSRQHEPLDTATLGPVKIDPSRPTLLEDEIEEQIFRSGGDRYHAARRILKIDRIAKALKMLDRWEDAERFLKRESSDAR